jgi:hypothetical protein
VAWEYHIEQWNIAERWSPKKQASELEAFQGKLNELGAQDWEMLGYESIPLVGGLTGSQKGMLYLCFFKRRT